MAKLIVYAVYDSKVETYAQPFQMRTRGEAIRGWESVANDPNTTVCAHPHDFALMELGYYDESTGRFENHTAPISLGLAVEFKRKAAENLPLFNDKKQGN